MLFSELKWTHATTARRVSQLVANADRSLIYRIVEDIPTGRFVARLMMYRPDLKEVVDSSERKWKGFEADITTIACFIHDLTPWGDK